MSNPHLNEAERWREIGIYNENEIRGFFGPYRFLSNFAPCEVFGYPSVENAYMAAKVKPEHRDFFKTCSPADAKKYWRQFPLIDSSPERWDARKYDVMVQLVVAKFAKNKELRIKLIETKNAYLEELNWWGDIYWGVDIVKGGDNNLGKILMTTRNFWI